MLATLCLVPFYNIRTHRTHTHKNYIAVVLVVDVPIILNGFTVEISKKMQKKRCWSEQIKIKWNDGEEEQLSMDFAKHDIKYFIESYSKIFRVNWIHHWFWMNNNNHHHRNEIKNESLSFAPVPSTLHCPPIILWISTRVYMRLRAVSSKIFLFFSASYWI